MGVQVRKNMLAVLRVIVSVSAVWSQQRVAVVSTLSFNSRSYLSDSEIWVDLNSFRRGCRISRGRAMDAIESGRCGILPGGNSRREIRSLGLRVPYRCKCICDGVGVYFVFSGCGADWDRSRSSFELAGFGRRDADDAAFSGGELGRQRGGLVRWL